MLELNKIYNMDCLEGMKQIPDKSIDLIVSDPPYGLNYNNGDLASRWEAIFEPYKHIRLNTKMKDNPIPNDGKEAHIIFEAFLIEANRILKKGACCCCCCGGGGPKPLFAKWTLMMDDIIGFKQAVVWDKGGLGMGMQYRRNYEFILIAQKGSPSHRWNGGRITPNVWNIPKIIPSEYQHPTAKPIELMEKIVSIHSDEQDVVLDGFVGHGPVPVACKRLNRNFIGFEISKEYVDIANKRIDNVPERLENWIEY